jgi:hypothetical protein
MATFNINIINPTIKLYSDVVEESNSCRSVFYFTIKTTPFAVISLEVDNSGREDYISLSAKGFVGHRGGRYTNVPKNTKAGSNGEIQVRLIIDNHTTQSPMGGFNGCNDATITISDYTNNIFSERRKFNRCGGLSCDDFPPPETFDDSYEVAPGATANLNILDNDKANTNYGTLTTTIVNQPQNGTVQVLDTGEVKYTHNGNGTTDSFTYYVTNSIGQRSEGTSTVSISITNTARNINNNTKVHILFDDSGSMDSTRDDLERMKDYELKEVLLPYYDDEARYNSQVVIDNIGDVANYIEHSFDAINNLAVEDSIFLIFQDEAESDYHRDPNTFDNSILEPMYETEITALNTKLDSLGRCDIVMFQVGGYPGFKSFLEAVENGTGAYAGNKGLSGRDNFKVKYDVISNSNGGYYANLVVDSLNELGFNI